jgi:hypothetical protein
MEFFVTYIVLWFGYRIGDFLSTFDKPPQNYEEWMKTMPVKEHYELKDKTRR